MKRPLGVKVFVAAVIVAEIAVAAVGLAVSGSPSQERARRFDQQRVNDLSSLTYAVDQYWNERRVLPDALDALATLQNRPYGNVSDPSTGAPYELHALGDRQYELCATFETETAVQPTTPVAPRLNPYDEQWKHGIGRTCFTRTVNAYPPTPLPIK